MARRLAPLAEKYGVRIGFHNHTNNYPALDKHDPILEISPMIGFNFDIGHYFAGTKGKSPIPVLEKYHDRIVSLHLKDRTADGRISQRRRAQSVETSHETPTIQGCTPCTVKQS